MKAAGKIQKTRVDLASGHEQIFYEVALSSRRQSFILDAHSGNSFPVFLFVTGAQI
jgi:hypothetical protein